MILKYLYIILVLCAIGTISVESKNKEKYLPVEIKGEGYLMKYLYDEKCRVVKSTIELSKDSISLFTTQDYEYTNKDLVKNLKSETYNIIEGVDTTHVIYVDTYDYVMQSDSLLETHLKKEITFLDKNSQNKESLDVMHSIIKYFIGKRDQVYKIQNISDDGMIIENQIEYGVTDNIIDVREVMSDLPEQYDKF